MIHRINLVAEVFEGSELRLRHVLVEKGFHVGVSKSKWDNSSNVPRTTSSVSLGYSFSASAVNHRDFQRTFRRFENSRNVEASL